MDPVVFVVLDSTSFIEEMLFWMWYLIVPSSERIIGFFGTDGSHDRSFSVCRSKAFKQQIQIIDHLGESCVSWYQEWKRLSCVCRIRYGTAWLDLNTTVLTVATTPVLSWYDSVYIYKVLKSITSSRVISILRSPTALLVRTKVHFSS